MTAVLAVMYASAIIFIGAFLFTAVEWLEPNRRFAIVFKCAILAAGGAALPISCCPNCCSQPSVWVDELSTEFADQ
jgi:hypothetical protein